MSRTFLKLTVPLFLLSPVWLEAVEIIAHRGASHDAPENTIVAAKLGWAQQADAVEIDLWLSKDGKVVTFHDADTKRFEKPERKIKSLTWEEIQTLDVGSFKGAEFEGVKVPLLESVLAVLPAGKELVLELKDGPEIVPAMVRSIRESAVPMSSLVVISFHEQTLRASKKALPEVPHYFLKGYKADPATGALPELDPLIDLCRDAGFEGLNLHFDWPVTPEFRKRLDSHNLKLLIWTVDDPATARRLANAGVDAITTNRPAWLREQLQKKND